jgi:hypothetical protein
MLARWTLGIGVHVERRWILPNKIQSLLKIERTRPPGHGSVGALPRNGESSKKR